MHTINFTLSQINDENFRGIKDTFLSSTFVNENRFRDIKSVMTDVKNDWFINSKGEKREMFEFYFFSDIVGKLLGFLYELRTHPNEAPEVCNRLDLNYEEIKMQYDKFIGRYVNYNAKLDRVFDYKPSDFVNGQIFLKILALELGLKVSDEEILAFNSDNESLANANEQSKIDEMLKAKDSSKIPTKVKKLG